MMDLSQSNKVICFNRIIDVDIYYRSKKNEDKVIQIRTPKYGLKPDISVSLNVLPSNNITSMIVTIRNMLTDIDISKAYYMTVAMGYDSCGVAVYDSIIFRSYQATPNPDGEFVFEGVVTGDTVVAGNNMGYQNNIGITEEDPFVIVWGSCGSVNLYDYVSAFLNGMDGSTWKGKTKGVRPKFRFSIVNDVDDDTLNKLKNNTISVMQLTRSFSTPLSRAVYAKNVLIAYADEHDIPITVVIDGNNFIIKSLQDDTTVVPSKAIDIIGYTSASFNGALLNLTLPYYPAINAGSILRCDANYVSQVGPPNTNGNDVLRKNESWSLYRVMKFSISFSTVRDNTMTIEAYPIKEAGKVRVSSVPVKDAGAKRNAAFGKSYIQDVLNNEYHSVANDGSFTNKIQLSEGNVIGTIDADPAIVTAQKHNYGQYFISGGVPVKYETVNIDDIINFMKVYKEYKDSIAVMIPSDEYYGPLQQYDIDVFFPIIFAATWYKRNSGDDTFCDSPPYYPVYFNAGYMFFPDVSLIQTGPWNQIVGVLNDFIDIYDGKDGYEKYVEKWKFMREHAKGMRIYDRESWFNPGE